MTASRIASAMSTVSWASTSNWIAQQLREAFPYEPPVKFLILDHDSKVWRRSPRGDSLDEPQGCADGGAGRKSVWRSFNRTFEVPPKMLSVGNLLIHAEFRTTTRPDENGIAQEGAQGERA